jgi:AI-2 transport protein TqsA
MNQSRTLSLLIGAAAAVILMVGIRAAADIVGPLMLALSLTILFHPLRGRFERRMPGWAASVLLLLFAYVLIIGLTLALVLSLGRMASLVASYGSDFDDLTANIRDALHDMGMGADQADATAGAMDITRLVDFVTGVLSGILTALSGLLFLGTLLLFLAFDSARADRLARGARKHRPQLVDALGSFAHGTRNYLGVSALFGLIVAIIDTAVLWAMGIPGALVWGVLAFVTNFIPNIGFVIGLIPPALLALVVGGWPLMLIVIAIYCVVNVTLQVLVQPKFISDAVSLSLTLSFFSVIFWTFIIGPLGAILSIPLTLLVRALVLEGDPGATWLRWLSGDTVTARDG